MLLKSTALGGLRGGFAQKRKGSECALTGALRRGKWEAILSGTLAGASPMAADYIPGADGEFDAWQANFACLPSAAEVEARHLKQRPPGLSEPAVPLDPLQ